MPYKPAPPPSPDADLREVISYLTQELAAVRTAFTLLEEGRGQSFGATPHRPRVAQLAYTNSLNWNPGYGAGYYLYDGSEWQRLMSLSGGSFSWPAAGVGAPSLAARSAGTKFTYYPSFSAGASADYAVGIEASTLWHGVPTVNEHFKWYGGATEILRLSNRLLWTGPTAGVASGWSDAAGDGYHQLGLRGAISAIVGGISVSVGNNCYWDGANWRYRVAATATLFNQNQSGHFYWYGAPSGVAGAAVAFNELAELSNTGVLTHRFADVLTRVGVTFSASMTFDAADGNLFNIVATSNIAHTINAPLNPSDGQHIWVRIANSSGGALGVATWNAVFKMAAWSQPANGFSRSIEFVYNGTNWLELTRTASNIPN